MVDMKNNLPKTKKNTDINKGLILLAITFIVNPCVNVFDYLPDFIGYFIIALGLSYFAQRTPHFEEARIGFLRLCCVSLAKIPAFLFMMLIREQNTVDNDIKSLFTFSLTAIETVLLITTVSHLFNAFSYLGQRGNAEVLITSYPLSKNGKRRSTPDALRIFCYVFIIYKFIATALPEMLLLTKTVDAGSYHKVFNVAKLYPYVIIFAVISVLVMGIILTKRFSKFITAINAEGKLRSSVEMIFDDISRETLDKKLKINKIKTTVTLFLIAAFFTADVNLDNLFGIDAVPNFIFGIIVILASVRLSAIVEKTTPTLLSGIVYSISALVAYYFHVEFMTEYGYELLTTSFAKSAYLTVIFSATSEFVFYTVLILFIMVAIQRLVKNHTGISRDNPNFSKIDEDYHRRMKMKVFVWGGCGILAGCAKLVHVILQYYSTNTLVAVENDVGVVTSGLIPWFNLVVFGTTVLFVCYSLYLFGKIKEEVEIKYS